MTKDERNTHITLTVVAFALFTVAVFMDAWPIAAFTAFCAMYQCVMACKYEEVSE